jgi:hypothetical protein
MSQVGGLKRVRANGGSIGIVCTQSRILRIFRITGLNEVFDIYDTVGDALDGRSDETGLPAVQAGHPPVMAVTSNLPDAGRRRAGDAEAGPEEPPTADSEKGQRPPATPSSASDSAIPSASVVQRGAAQAAGESSLFPVTIYLSEAADHEQVQSAVERLLAEAGLRIDSRDDPVVGSWFLRMRAVSGKPDAHPDPAQDPRITADLMQNLPSIIQSLQPFKEAVIRLGAVLIVKVDQAVAVHQLTGAQQAALGYDPQLAATPHAALAALKILTPNSDSRAAGQGWDFFISYTQADREWADWITWVLEEDGYRVLIQAWDCAPGSNWVAGTQAALRTIALLSAAYLKSVYGSSEWQEAWSSGPQDTDRRLLAVRITDCDRPGPLAEATRLDLFGLDKVVAHERLREMISTAVAGRAKPSAAPGFSGDARAVPDEPQFPGARQDLAVERDAYLQPNFGAGASPRRNATEVILG